MRRGELSGISGALHFLKKTLQSGILYVIIYYVKFFILIGIEDNILYIINILL